VDDAATESRLSSSAKNDTEDGDDDDFDDEDDEIGHGGGASVTEKGEIKTKHLGTWMFRICSDKSCYPNISEHILRIL
jgi:hypothetical protein